MISDIHNEIDHTDANTMDDVYDSCNSIKKLIETLNYSLSEFAPNLQLYFMIVAFDELFNNEKNETKTLERIFKSLNVDEVSPTMDNVLSKKYSISRAVYWIINEDVNPKIQEIVDYALSLGGHEIVKAEGFVPVK